MIKSMTGYGRSVASGDGEQVAVEISSVNRKTLDITVSLPREWQRLEPEIVAIVKQRAQRGRISISIAPEIAANGESRFFSPAAVGSVLGELKELSEQFQIPFEPDAKVLLDLAIFARGRTAGSDAEAISGNLLAAIERATDEMIEMRKSEGEVLARDLAERQANLEAALKRIREAAESVVPDYRETLLKRLRQSGLDFTLEDERVLKEIALFADRADISEELTRLESHFEQFGEFLKVAEPVGRKFEFLLQEIGREFNTIGSKASDSEISRIVIECKNELERIREQVQNVE